MSTLVISACAGAGTPSSRSDLNAAVPSRLSRTSSAVVGYSSLILAANPAAYYQLSDDGPTMTDAGPNGLNGTFGSAVVHNIPSLTSETNAAAGFPGGSYAASDMALVAPSALLNPAGAVTVEAWIVEAALNLSHLDLPIVAYGVNPGYSYELTVSAQNKLRFRVHTLGPATYYSAYGTTPLQPGKAYHVVGTYDGVTVSVYLNGVLDGSVAATGAIRTFPVVPATGSLAIGGALNTSNPLFDGDAEDVAIYARALGVQEVSQHYGAGLATPPLNETPSQADAFVDSIGVNTHFHYLGTSYTTNYGTIKSMLVASGIRHIREGLYEPTWLGYYSELNDLASSGIHALLEVPLGLSQTDIATLPAKYYQSSMEAFEGPNEPDLGSDPNWVTNARAFQQMLYTTLKSNPATAQYPVYAPAVVTPTAAGRLGNLSTYLDDGNIHDYFGMYNPGNTGYGSITPWGYYGTIGFFKSFAAQVSGTKPIVTTETGYATAGSAFVSNLAGGKYTLRTFFEHFNNGIARTYVYEMIDESGSVALSGSVVGFNFAGLLDGSLQPKPAYNAMKGLIKLLSDKGARFAPTRLSYTLAGNITNLTHTLLDKRDGTYYLALWLEVPSWNVQTLTDIGVPSQNVQVRLPFNPSSASLATFDDAGNLTTGALGFKAGTAAVPVADRVTVLVFHP